MLYKLYNDIGVRFPLPVTDFDAGASSTLHSHLHVLNGVLRDAKGSASTAVAEAVGTIIIILLFIFMFYCFVGWLFTFLRLFELRRTFYTSFV